MKLRQFILALPVAMLLFTCCASMPRYRADLSQAPRRQAKPKSEKQPKSKGKWELYQVGVASYYGDGYQGNTTANGETFNKNNMTAAHRELEFDTEVKVTNIYNNKSVIVRINDRGPFKDNRIIDLSEKAAKELEMTEQGTVPVRLEVKK